jgi:hypothetical protein
MPDMEELLAFLAGGAVVCVHIFFARLVENDFNKRAQAEKDQS